MIIYSPPYSYFTEHLPLYLMLRSCTLYILKESPSLRKTQSHLIEILSGIQTVKAQHFELTARWKWQDRYRDFVTEGFKGLYLDQLLGK